MKMQQRHMFILTYNMGSLFPLTCLSATANTLTKFLSLWLTSMLTSYMFLTWPSGPLRAACVTSEILFNRLQHLPLIFDLFYTAVEKHIFSGHTKDIFIKQLTCEGFNPIMHSATAPIHNKDTHKYSSLLGALTHKWSHLCPNGFHQCFYQC